MGPRLSDEEKVARLKDIGADRATIATLLPGIPQDGSVFYATRQERHLTPLSEYSTDPPDPTLLDRLDPNEATILYGPGGVGKGTVAASWAVGLWKAGRKVAILDYEDHPSEWSRRIHSLGGAEAWESIAHMSPNRAYPPGPRGYAGLAGHPDQIRTELDEAEGAYVIIDSAIMAAPRQARPPQTRARFL